MSCGKCGHTSKQCTDSYLPAWERAYLKEIVFGDPSQVGFVHLGGGEKDQDNSPFGCHNTPAPYQSFTSYDTTRSNSVSVGWEQQPSLASELNSMSVNAFYGESSGPNKEPNMEGAIPWSHSVHLHTFQPIGLNEKDRNEWVRKRKLLPLLG